MRHGSGKVVLRGKLTCAVCCAHAGKGKVLAYAGVPDALTKRLNAGQWVKEVLAVLGGKGGGKPHTAQGQGIELDKVPAALSAAADFAKQHL